MTLYVIVTKVTTLVTVFMYIILLYNNIIGLTVEWMPVCKGQWKSEPVC